MCKLITKPQLSCKCCYVRLWVIKTNFIMKTLINELIAYLKIRNEGIEKVLRKNNLTNYETDRYNGMYDMNLQIIQELETDYLHKEKERIMSAFDFGRNIYGDKNSEDFLNFK